MIIMVGKERSVLPGRDEGLGWRVGVGREVRRRGMVDYLGIGMLQVIRVRVGWVIRVHVCGLLMRESIIRSHLVEELGLVELSVLHDCLTAVRMVDLALNLLVTLEQAVEVHEVIL